MVHVLEKIERLGNGTVLPNELDAELAGVRGLPELLHQAETLERKIAEGHERFAHVIAGKFFLLDDQDIVPLFGQDGSGC